MKRKPQAFNVLCEATMTKILINKRREKKNPQTLLRRKEKLNFLTS